MKIKTRNILSAILIVALALTFTTAPTAIAKDPPKADKASAAPPKAEPTNTLVSTRNLMDPKQDPASEKPKPTPIGEKVGVEPKATQEANNTAEIVEKVHTSALARIKELEGELEKTNKTIKDQAGDVTKANTRADKAEEARDQLAANYKRLEDAALLLQNDPEFQAKITPKSPPPPAVAQKP